MDKMFNNHNTFFDLNILHHPFAIATTSDFLRSNNLCDYLLSFQSLHFINKNHLILNKENKYNRDNFL